MELQLIDACVRAGDRTVFESLSLTCRPGEMTGLVGASGAGKTTALHCLGLLVTPDEGVVRVSDQSTLRWSDKRRRQFWRDDAAFIFQDYGLIDDDSVEYNVGVGRRGGRKLVQKHVAEALAKVGLSDRELETISRLSGGEKQRVGLARAIAKEAKYVFADEPTASLDAQNRAVVIRVLQQCAQAGAVVVVATHDEEVMQACNALHELGTASGQKRIGKNHLDDTKVGSRAVL